MRLSMLAPAAFALVLSGGAALAAGDMDFTLRNKTGYQIDNVYLSKPSARSWGSDVMGRGRVLEDDDSTNITFRDSARGCHWDLRVMYHDRTTAEWSNLDLCEISTVTLHYDRRAGVTRATTD